MKEKILVVGIGGAGNNSIKRFEKTSMDDFEFLIINNEDREMEDKIKKLLVTKIGFSKKDIAHLKNEFNGVKKVFILAGLGGKIGSKLVPETIKIAKKSGAQVTAILTYPFSLEKRRVLKAESVLSKVKKLNCEIIIHKNEDLIKKYPNLKMNEAFKLADEELRDILHSSVCNFP